MKSTLLQRECSRSFWVASSQSAKSTTWRSRRSLMCWSCLDNELHESMQLLVILPTKLVRLHNLSFQSIPTRCQGYERPGRCTVGRNGSGGAWVHVLFCDSVQNLVLTFDRKEINRDEPYQRRTFANIRWPTLKTFNVRVLGEVFHHVRATGTFAS